MSYRAIHSFIFSKSFILARIAVDLELIPRTMSVRWEYTLDELPITHLHTFMHRDNLAQPIHHLLPGLN